jgi:hypothetical protein
VGYNVYRLAGVQAPLDIGQTELIYEATYVKVDTKKSLEAAIETGHSLVRGIRSEGEVTIDLEHGARGDVTAILLTGTRGGPAIIEGNVRIGFRFPSAIIRHDANEDRFTRTFSFANPGVKRETA